ncbi:MAG TPA: bifunctional UDP-N-acetylglucosamine diphosphorylase/glucosamine-1-phosphate N-acetyltransferase GlmU [Ktedonobacterales bacterium]|nr:bifunctional UDP-N-acetylglucosamine diphosphorylase/glucosamine-1-phosphate N-acetyltransferase GlmU [Ktedonobacterales bacterium]
MRPVGVIILAAGKGTRMRSRLPKVAHSVAGRAMLEHALRAAAEAIAPATSQDDSSAGDDGSDHSRHSRPHHTTFAVVVGHEAETVRAAVHWEPPRGALTYVVQELQLGTGHAVHITQQAMMAGDDAPETILVTYGDTPLTRPETLRRLLEEHERAGATVTFLTGVTDEPGDYGRVLRDRAGRVKGIVEAKHADGEQTAIREVNSGIYAFDAAWLWSRLKELAPHPNGEYYLTDMVDLAVAMGRPVATLSAPMDEAMGVNDRVALAEAERIMRQRILRELMLSGVTIEDPAATYIEAGVTIGQDTIIHPGCALRGATAIGAGCEIGPQSVIRDSQIGNGCLVYASWVEEAVMEEGSRIGPMSHLRPGARLKRGAFLGNFAEVKNSVIGEGVDMHHFSYVGDATVGAHTNIGAGAITMNYDGREKHHTEIGERVFIGCDTLLRAPVTVGDDASTGGGAVVTRDVPPGALAVGMPARVARRVRSQRTQPSDQANGAGEQTGADRADEPPDARPGAQRE